MFLPATRTEMTALGWQRPDIILISGDAWIDSPFMGVALVGRYLSAHGFKVAVIAQPDVESDADITRLGEPTLFWGVSGGAVDSMVANYTASGRRRKSDDYTPGGINNRRPDRAVIVYANLIRRHFKQTAPIVLGGIEASLRRIAHYDFASRKVRRSILFDARADWLIFGMGHRAALELARTLQEGGAVGEIRGLARIAGREESVEGYTPLPSFEEVQRDNDALTSSFSLFYKNMDALTAEPLSQRHGDRQLLLNRPPLPPTTAEMDELHGLEYARTLHPHCARRGDVRALTTLRFSLPTHWGCYGECNFCAIAVHQGRTVSWRSQSNIVAEVTGMTGDADFKGNIHDLGGPTANMYGFECAKKRKLGACADRRCLYPKICPSLRPDHGAQLALLQAVERIPGVKRVFIASGIRHDLILADGRNGRRYLEKLCCDHVSGQIKLAPEHTVHHVLALMGKENVSELLAFKRQFEQLSKKAGRRQFITCYFIAAHPGCTQKDMEESRRFCQKELGLRPEQVQIFTPTPSTWSTLMYATGCDPFSGRKLFVERDVAGKERQKQALVEKRPQRKSRGGPGAAERSGSGTSKRAESRRAGMGGRRGRGRK